MKTRSVAAKESASESGYESRRPRVFENPPRSPSTSVSGLTRAPRPSYGAPAARTDPAVPTFAHPATAAAGGGASEIASVAFAPRLPETNEPAAPAPMNLRAVESLDPSRQETGPLRVTHVEETSGRETASTIRTRRSYSSDVARVKKAEYEAQRKIAAIRNEQLEIEKALVSKRFEYEVSVIQAETDAREQDSVRGSDNGMEERVDEWLQRMDRSRPPVADQLVEEQPPRPAVHVHVVDGAAAARIESATCDNTATLPANNRSRPRSSSRSPSRDARRTGRGIEQLAETLERMTRIRPPPRQVTELPTFTGVATEWLPFKAAYNDSSTVYKFTAVENLSRLRNCIKGEARETVSALLYTASDPQVIMSTLEQYYGRPEILIDRVMEDLKKLPRLTGSSSELNAFAVKLQNIVCVLSNMDNRGYIWNPLLVREVVDRLSPHVKSRWCDYASDAADSSQEPEIILLSRFLMREADRAMRYAFATTATAPGQKKEARAAPQAIAKKRASRDVIYATTEEKKAVECLCCNGEHEVPKCPKFLKMSVNERWEWARTAKVCFKCINKRHRREHCRKKRCGVGQCDRSHHALLHQEREAQAITQKKDDNTDTGSSNDAAAKETVMAVSASGYTRQRVLLKICPVTLKGPGGETKTFALLDEGSTVSLIDEDLANSIQASGPTSTLRIRGVATQQREVSSQTLKMQIRGQRGGFHELCVRTMKNLRLHSQSMEKSTFAGYPHLRDLEGDAFVEEATPKILIGADNWHLIVTRELRTGRRNEPAASYTQLGWVIHGTAPRVTLKGEEGYVVQVVLHIEEEKHDVSRVEELVKSHFNIDALGVSLAKKVGPEDSRAIRMVEQTLRKIGDHYEVGLPWRNVDEAMPDNFNGALKRLKTLERKMDLSPCFASQYETMIRNLLEKGYAQECDGTEERGKKVWYLPHFPVVNPNKPGKVRMVFDAACRYGGVCLNDHLLEGPDLLRSLPGILFRFRERPVAVTADIQEMFLQVKIRKQDQPAQMFLWRGKERVKPPTKYKMTSMIFGASCSPFIAHTVRDANAKLHAHEFPNAVQAITANHYMDDYVDSFTSKEEAIQTAQEVIKIHRNAHFNLRGWCSNVRPVVAGITAKEQEHDVNVRLGQREEGTDKTLGLLWQTNTDELGFNTGLSRVATEVKSRRRSPSKREALAAVMSVYDPLGLISHFTVTGKIILQGLWRNGVGWDDEIPDEDAARFEEWMQSLDKVAMLRVPRWYGKAPDDTIEMHVFCDASEQAYAAAAYWRIQRPDGRVEVKLVAARARVAPLRALTIPRLELQAAVIGARLGNTIISEHRDKPERVTYWTDSQTVLRWIEKDAARYTPFVAHRLGEIAELTDATQWRWVPTEHNVADDATRPTYTLHPRACDRWFTGPAFLYEREDTWPKEKSRENLPEDEATCAMVTTTKSNPSHLPDVRRFSSYEKLLRTTAIPLLFLQKCKDKTKQVTVELIERAEVIWIKQAQLDEYAEEIRLLEKKRPIPKTSRLYKLDPILEDGILRVRGRIGKATIAAAQKTPVILHGRHPYTRLLVEQAHRQASHANNERVINELRQRYWIIHLRPTVRAVARQCQLCRIRRTRPVQPIMGDLPRERLSARQRPFSNCGVDYFGPLTVTIGRRHEKRWVALFTCLTTRAVHLEIVTSLSTDSALMAVRRMAARRGWPRIMYSDNGTNFKGADVELRAAYNDWAKHFVHFGLGHRMKWKFIPPGAPHMGGAWERLVRSVKTALGAVLHQRALKEEVLLTLMAEAEHAVNSRPLTHVSVDPRDPEALTPNHFLIGASSGLPYTGPCDEDCRRQWRITQALADHFWRRWVTEYLPTLVPRGASDDQRPPLRVDSLVIVVDATLPRSTWPRGVVEAVYSGPDGKVRSADVRTPAGTFRRPVTKLAVLRVEV